MRIDNFAFGTIRIDGESYDRDVVLDRGRVLARKKKPSKRFRNEFGHTPLSLEEAIPWQCKRLVIGTGAEGALPVMPAVVEEARKRGVDLVAVKTARAIELLNQGRSGTNAVLHITC